MSTEHHNTEGAERHWSMLEQLRARVDYLEARLVRAGEDLSRYSMSAGQADQRMAESRAVRKALGFEEDAEDVAPRDLIDAIARRRAEMMTPGVAAIAAERRRQVEQEGWSPEHDDEHDDGDLAAAASAYAINAADQLNPYSFGDGNNETPLMWPWDAEWWKPTTPRRDLEKAGALIAAEWERQDRVERRQAEEQKL